VNIVREPLLHFVVLGAALFGLFAVAGREGADEPARIIVSTAQIANLQGGFARTWQRPPTAQETQGLIEDHLRDEVYYREGRALGLDRDDIIIRRRLRQKMEFMAEEMATAAPQDQELQEFLASHPDKFRSEDRLTFRQVFLSARRAQALQDDAQRVAAALADDDGAVETTGLGDAFLLGQEFRGVSQSEVTRTFGERFAERLVGLEQGRWSGPLPSEYGLHVVLLEERIPGALPQLDAVRSAVRREVLNARRIESEERLYRALRQRYEVSVEAAPVGQQATKETAGAVR
jgi:PPIC-type PPIASE domain